MAARIAASWFPQNRKFFRPRAGTLSALPAGIHVAMEYYSGGKYYWDYDAVKAAFDKVQ
jgi:hypothetical protein